MSEIRDSIFKFTKSVSKTSGDIIKSTKLSMNLASEEDRLKKIYMEIGKKVHEIYQYGGSLGKFFDEQYEAIQDCEAKIADLTEKLNVVKGARLCPKCGKNVEKASEFCPKCGAGMEPADDKGDSRFENAAPGERIEAAEAGLAEEGAGRAEAPEKVRNGEPVAETVVCDSCQAKNEAKAKFCLGCGRVLPVRR